MRYWMNYPVQAGMNLIFLTISVKRNLIEQPASKFVLARFVSTRQRKISIRIFQRILKSMRYKQLKLDIMGKIKHAGVC